MFLRNLYTSTFLYICLLVTTAVQKIVKAKIHRDTCTSSSSAAPGRHERRGAWLLVRPLDRQHIWISQQPQLSWCKKLGEPTNPLYHKGHKHHNMLHTGGVKRDLLSDARIVTFFHEYRESLWAALETAKGWSPWSTRWHLLSSPSRSMLRRRWSASLRIPLPPSTGEKLVPRNIHHWSSHCNTHSQFSV